MTCLLTATSIFCQPASLQWTREDKLPASNIFTLFYYRDTLFAGGSDKVYIGQHGGQTWDSTAIVLPNLYSIDAITEFNNELYVASYSTGVFKSSDLGRHWQDITGNIFPYVSRFYEWKGNLYAGTLGNGVYLLGPNGNTWTEFNNGLYQITYNINTLTGNDRVLVGAGSPNGDYVRMQSPPTQWEYDLLEGTNMAGLSTDETVSANDTLFLSSLGRGSNVYTSTDDAVSWQKIGTFPSSTHMALVNAREAILLARNYFNGINNVQFYYRYKNGSTQWVSFSTVTTETFCFEIAITGERLWYAATNGLYSIPLSSLPGITSYNTPSYSFSVGQVYPNPVTRTGNIDINLAAPDVLDAALYDATGKQVAIIANHQNLYSGHTTIPLNMNWFPAGMYFLHINIHGQSFTQKIIHAYGFKP